MLSIRRLKTLLLGVSLAAAASLTGAAPAYAWPWSPHVEVYAQACIGGHITDLWWNTQNENGVNAYAQNQIHISLDKVPSRLNGGSYLWIHVKCDNGQWYSHGQYVNRPISGANLNIGAI